MSPLSIYQDTVIMVRHMFFLCLFISFTVGGTIWWGNGGRGVSMHFWSILYLSVVKHFERNLLCKKWYIIKKIIIKFLTVALHLTFVCLWSLGKFQLNRPHSHSVLLSTTFFKKKKNSISLVSFE